MGVGLGGFVDGIVLHQILQWHHMLTSTDSDNIGLRDYPATTVEGLEVNTLWDGLFHASTWLFVAVGLALLWRAWQQRQAPRAGRSLAGLLLAGWGLFNLVEDIVEHHLLGIHHVRSGDYQLLSTLASSPLARHCWPAAGRCTARGWLELREQRPTLGLEAGRIRGARVHQVPAQREERQQTIALTPYRMPSIDRAITYPSTSRSPCRRSTWETTITIPTTARPHDEVAAMNRSPAMIRVAPSVAGLTRLLTGLVP